MKECLKPHSLVHSLVGIGLGILLVNWFNYLYGGSGVAIGGVILIGGLLGELSLMGKKK